MPLPGNFYDETDDMNIKKYLLINFMLKDRVCTVPCTFICIMKPAKDELKCSYPLEYLDEIKQINAKLDQAGFSFYEFGQIEEYAIFASMWMEWAP